MGNWFGRSKLMLKPLENDIGMMKRREDEDERRKSFSATSSPITRIKVRMPKRQLEELKAQAETSKGNSELGRLIVKESLEGRLSPHAVVGQPHFLENSRSRHSSLSTIDEVWI